MEEALNPEKIQGISHRRNSMKKLRTARRGSSDFPFVRNFCNCGGNEINVFQSLLENMFGKENVTEVELNQNQQKQVADVKGGKKMARYNYRKT